MLVSYSRTWGLSSSGYYTQPLWEKAIFPLPAGLSDRSLLIFTQVTRFSFIFLKYRKTKHNKLKQKLSHGSRTRQSNRIGRAQEKTQESETHSFTFLVIPWEHWTRSHAYYIYTEDLVQTQEGSVHAASVFLSSYEPCSCWFTGPSFLGALHHLWLLLSFCHHFLEVLLTLRGGTWWRLPI